MRLRSIEGNSQRLDGGAMYGNCPRPLWERWSRPDERHRIPLACRALLVEDGDRRILLEAGIGAFFEPKLRERFGVVEPGHVLLDNLAAVGLSDHDIDVVVLSHLHFDHAGGLLSAWSDGEPPRLLFPRATFVVGRAAWQRATEPNFRDRASFIPELHAQLEQSGRLELLGESSAALPSDRYRFLFSEGHTPGLTMTRIATARGPVTFVGDLIPGVPWIHLPITMGYDRFPERLIEEKRGLLEQVIADGGWLFLTHDPEVAACRVERADSGRYQAVEALATVDWQDG